MKPLTLRQQNIVDAALDIIAAQGIQRMTIKNLARAVKVSEPALYRHFNSKFHILTAILHQYRNNLADLIRRSVEANQSSVDTIALLYGEMFQGFADRPALSAVIFSEDLFRYDRRLSREAYGIVKMTHDFIFAAFREGARRKEIRTDVPAHQLAWMVMGAMRLLITRWRISGYSLDLMKEGREIIGHIRKVLSPQ